MPLPAKAFTLPKSQGEQFQPSEANAIDDGQADRLSRSYVTPLTAAAGVDCDDYDFTVTSTGTGRFKPEADKTEFSGSGFPLFATVRTLTDVVPPTCVHFDRSASPAVFAENGFTHIQQVGGGASDAINFWISLPIDAVLTSVKVPVKKASGGTLPSAFPTVALYRVDLTASESAITVASAVTDAPADLAAYKAFHVIERSVSNHIVLAGNNYLITVTGDDNSSNISNGVFIYRPRVTFTMDRIKFI